MRASYRWLRSLGFKRRRAAWLTILACRLSRHDPPTNTWGDERQHNTER